MFHSIIQNKLGLSKNDKLYRQAYLLLSIMSVVVFVLLFYILYNLLVTHLYMIMSLEVLSLLFIYLSWYVLIKKKNIDLSSNILLLTIFTLTLLFFFDQKHHDYALAQAVIFPTFCIYLKGFKKGTLYSLIYISIVLALAFTGIGNWEEVAFTSTSFTNLTFTYLVLIAIIYYYEFSRSEAFSIIEKAHKELEGYKENLEEKVHIALEEKRQQEAILIQQSKMAIMGEMIDSIAHQWKQPLSTTATIIQASKIKDNLAHKHDSEKEEVFDKIMAQVEYMDKTISDFSNFFKPQTQYEFFSFQDTLNDVNQILQAPFKNHKINFKCEQDYHHIMIKGHRSEFSQVLLNILSNAKDAITDRIEQKSLSYGEGEIRLALSIRNHDIEICISDNGGGIPSTVLDNIFDAYFTTKKDKGTGIGLYMSQMIMKNHMRGDIHAENKGDGTAIYLTLQGVEKLSENEG
ncbi:HAMP domain-containing histidine kinase [Sulfurimonas sp. MAG313]|nr:HAMP domain-containing sensor histidine kinase [Sulfurimonas sp. MAG313]MDF1880532.1 HAMP domain-containing histidine kinase [Sulfurimonas sp. MAG313]